MGSKGSSSQHPDGCCVDMCPTVYLSTLVAQERGGQADECALTSG